VNVSARARFAALVEREPVPLDEAALALAAEEYPELDPAPWLARLDALAERVRAAAEGPRPAALLRALRQVLVEEERFRGNEGDYHDPRNSFLSDVLERKVGIPISLSVVWMEVAQRAGLALEGVGFPGHFLAKYAAPGGVEVYVDAFNAGELLTADECVARYHRFAGGREFDPRYLAAVSPRQILARMLHNLKRLSIDRKDDVRVYWTCDRLLVLAPGQLEQIRDRGLAAARLGGAAVALRDLEEYLERAPGAADAGAVRRVASALRGRAALSN
jgi:regulator of sirC expression with transglutaminase-like and TPR domain